MGRKIDIKKIEDVTKCQVTFSKRRTSLIKKANEIAVACDVDVAFVAFSPSGRVSKYCNKQRMEDVLTRYVDLPPESRLTHLENVQGKVEKLKTLSYMNSDDSKLHYLDKRIENLQLQIKKKNLELQILETDLRDYEVVPEQEPASLHQLSWCERNLNRSLEKVLARKNALVATISALSKQPMQIELENQTGLQYSSNISVNELASATQNGQAGDIMMKHVPWTSPYGAKARESIFQDLVDQTNIAAPNNNHAGPSHMYNFPLPDSSKYASIAAPNMNIAGPSHMYNFPLPGSSTILQQSSMVDSLLKLPDQINADTWNNFSSGSIQNAAHKSTQTLCDFQAPRFTSTTMVAHNPCNTEMPQSIYSDIIGTSSQFPNSNFNQFNMEGGETIGQIYMNFGDNLSNTVVLNGSIDVDRSVGMNSSQKQQMQAPFEYLHPENDVFWDTALNGNIITDKSGGMNSSQIQQMQAPSQYLQPEKDVCQDTALNGSIGVDKSGGMNSSQMQQMQAPFEHLQPEKDVCRDKALDGSIDVDRSGGMNSSQTQKMQAPAEYLQPEKDNCQDTALNGSIVVDIFGGMNSSQMQQMQAPSEYLLPEKDVCQDTSLNGSIGVDRSGGMNSSQMQQMQASPEYLQPEMEVSQDTLFDNVDKEAAERNMPWTSNTQKNDFWDWEDLLVTDNFEFGESSKQ